MQILWQVFEVQQCGLLAVLNNGELRIARLLEQMLPNIPG